MNTTSNGQQSSSADPLLVVKQDEQGVAGFFEDLPILLFVLAGTLTIVVSSVSASATVASIKETAKLDLIANRCVELLLSDILGGDDGNHATLASLCSTRVCQIAEDFLGKHPFCVGLLMIHPELRWLLENVSRGSGVPERAGSASRLFNAFTDNGLSAILVVRIIVW